MTQTSGDRGRRLPFAFSTLDPSVRRNAVWLEASDTAGSFGMLYRPARHEPRTAVYLVHPRADFTRHYAVPGLAARGYAVFGHNSRYLNNDTDMVHERLLLDVAAGMRFLKDQGFERVVLLGNSGGGSLFGFYQSQAERAPVDRLTQTPGGERIDLAGEAMYPGDLYIAVAAHPGQGRFMLNVLDPAVTDERDPLSNDPDWDMYNPANGYRPWPEPSSYEAAWIAAYRHRQRERNRRLDLIAREYLAEHAYFRSQLRDARFESLPEDMQTFVKRRGHLWRYMVVYRTLANPAYLDPSIDPNRRAPGSIFSPGDPIIGNYGPGGLARTITPRAWLSTWSGLSSNADLPENIQHLRAPTLLVYADADSDIFPSEQDDLLHKSAAADKRLLTLPWADHYLNPAGEEGGQLQDPRERLIDIIVPWIQERIGEP